MPKPKARDHIITAADLKEYLSTKDDFALELYVYHKAKEHGLIAKHGGTYTDPVTKKSRQFDIRAYSVSLDYRLDLAIECKSLQPTYPLLLSRIPRAPTESFHQIIDHDYGATAAVRMIDPSASSGKVRRYVGSKSIYRTREFVAKAITQVGRDKEGNLVSRDDGVYDKWSQALASADELVYEAEYGQHLKITKKLLTFIVPVLVVSDGTLWVADYSEDGREVSEPVQTDESVLFVGQEYNGRGRLTYTISHLHIVTKSQVGAFFDRLIFEYRQQIFHRGREVDPKVP